MNFQTKKSFKELRQRWILNFGNQLLPMLDHAYELATYCHDGQERRSGDPYISHCLAVAEILLVEGSSPTVVIAGLLHDTLNAGHGADLLHEEMGGGITELVENVTALDQEMFPAHIWRLGENVLTVKLADRLHNARTWDYVSLRSTEAKAMESLQVYVSVAPRLHLNGVGMELKRRSEYRLKQVAELRKAGEPTELFDFSTVQLASRRASALRPQN